MPKWLHRTTKQLLNSIASADLSEPIANYIKEPDLSAVEGISPLYWNIVGNIISEMSQVDKDSVDAANLSLLRDQKISSAVDDLESDFRQIVKMIISELNILRAEHGLADRTITQVKTQLRGGYGS